VALNTWQQHRIAQLVVSKLFGTVTGKRLAVLGFAFKADTNDTRESPAIRICLDLLEEGAQLVIVDPKVRKVQIAEDLAQASDGGWQLASTALEAATGADAVLLLTEWAEFGELNWEGIGSVMRKPAWLFDARATADAGAARAAGLNVWRVGEG